jgi:hypothetical protein
MAYYNPAQEQPQIQIQYTAPIVYYAAPAITYQSAVSRPYGPYYEKQTSTGLGATQIILACLSIAAGVMAIVYGAGWYPVGIGIWGGAFFLVTGALSIAAGKDPTNALITGTLVFSVFDIIIGVAMITIASFGVSEDIYCSSYYNNCSSWWGAAVAANSLMIAIGALEFIFGIWMTVISGRAIDRGSKAQLASMPVAFAQNHQPQTMYIQGLPPTFQPQPPPYYVQAQYPSESNPQQMIQIGVQHPSASNQQQPMMQIGVHQPPMTINKLLNQPSSC